MIILDTQVVSQLQIGGQVDLDRFDSKLEAIGDNDVWITVVTPYEQLHDCINRIKLTRAHPEHGTTHFVTLSFLMKYYARAWLPGRVLPFDEPAVAVFRAFPKKLVSKIKVCDAAIAAIALSRNGILISANRRDFNLVPGLRFETW